MTVRSQSINRDTSAAFDVGAEVIYLNSAGFGPRLRAVNDAALAGLYASARPWEAAADDWIAQTEELRSLAARLLRVSADALAFTPSVSYAMAIAARNCPIKKGQNVVVLDGEYPSNRMVWENSAQSAGAAVRYAAIQTGQHWTDAVLAQIDDDSAVLSIPHCHWSDGSLLNLQSIAAKAHQVGAALVIDASQSLGVMHLDVDTMAPDFVIVPGHKWLLGGYGLGWLWASQKHCSDGVPIEQTILARDACGDFASMGRALPAYRKGARRFDFGPFPHPLSVPMSLAALRQIEQWGIDNIRTRLQTLNEYLRQKFDRRALLAGLSRAPHAPHFCAWRAESEAQCAAVFSALHANRIIVAKRAGGIRLAPHLHITESAMDRVADVIARAV